MYVSMLKMRDKNIPRTFSTEGNNISLQNRALGTLEDDWLESWSSAWIVDIILQHGTSVGTCVSLTIMCVSFCKLAATHSVQLFSYVGVIHHSNYPTPIYLTTLLLHNLLLCFQGI